MGHYETAEAEPSPKRVATTLFTNESKADAPATDAALIESVLPTTYTARNACTNVAIALSKTSLVTTLLTFLRGLRVTNLLRLTLRL